MKGKIAIEPALTNVKSYLAQQGYTVDSMNEQSKKDLQGYDAVIVTWLSKDLLGIQDAETQAVVINADGLSAEEVAERLKVIH
jgi:Uncharacterised protein family (UPF0180).